MGLANDDVWVVIPVFNEAGVLESVVRETLAVFPNVVCVDDGSGDGSADIVLRTRAHLVRHPVNLGQGAALQTGLSYARNRPGAAYFVTFDADGQHRLEDAAAMVAVARSGEVDVVVGSRFLGSGRSVPPLKRLVLRTAALLSPSGRRLGLTDAHNGLRVFTRPVVDDLRITMNGMAHASEIVSYLGGSRWRVREVPVSIRYTEYSQAKGQSLVNGVTILFDLSVRSRRG
ncbi:MAG TPA: glycosyltransferase family 2 protein [Pseudonocardia sp.]|jgi:polyprenyl-phospho-N-acetylgalactosaminyl synthase|nr:glycosyltransferase family 2 protein [Pseudonocardia sp.]